MSSNNYFGFTHSGAQYGQAGSYQTAQTGYAVTPASYTTQRTGYETAYTPTATNPTPATAYASTYGGIVSAVSAGASASATYDYGYARPAAASYETPKTYYQQPVQATYSTAEYQQATTAKPAYSTGTYTGTAARPVPLTTQPKVAYAAANTVSYQTQTPQPVAATYSTAYAVNTQQQTATQTPAKPVEKKPSIAKYVVPTVTTTSYQTASHQGYAAAFTSAGAAAHISSTNAISNASQWQAYKKPFMGNAAVRNRVRQPPKPQQIHYCEVCKISCGGILTYREHLEGQKHKKKEAAAKAGAPTPLPGRHGHTLVCELCDVTCTGQDAYAAHVRGSKHQKVVKLHTKLGKPIPNSEPVIVKNEAKVVPPTTAPAPAVVTPATTTTTTPAPSAAVATTENEPTDMETVEPDIEPVGQDYIEEITSADAKVIFNCKLCDCKFNDPNAKEMHMKGRRHRLQYKKKVDPSLVVDVKINNRSRKMFEDRMKRQFQREDYFRQREDWGAYPMPPLMHRPFDGPMGPMMGGMGMFPQMRRPESAYDRHVLARHSTIYPKKDELDAVHKIISHNEKALKMVSDFLAEEAQKKAAPKTGAKLAAVSGKPEEKKDDTKKVDGSDGTMFSFQQGKEEIGGRVLKGAMRVGALAKGLLLTGDTAVDLVVLCAEKPTRTLLLKVAEVLPKQLQAVAPDEKYMVQKKPEDAAITVMDTKEPHYTVTITFTSPLMREQVVADPNTPAADGKGAMGGQPTPVKDPPDVLDKAKCLDALAALRHAKWFQARAQGLQGCVMVIRIMRDLCQRVPTWAPLNSWAMELLVEKVMSSSNGPLSLGDSLRRVMEAVSSGILLPGGPGLMDPCEKEAVDAVGNISNQQREDITASAQHALRLIAFRQVHKVLGMDPLPVSRFARRFPRKRRLEGSVGDGADGADGKKVKDETAEAEAK